MPNRLFPGILILLLSWQTIPQQLTHPTSLEGLWLSDGYGLMVELKPDELQTYELTSISCIASRHAKPSDKTEGVSTVVFLSGSATIRITRTDDPNTLAMHTDGTASDIILHRTSTRPGSCGRDQVNSPKENYRIFWQTFAEQYPFFALHQLDWHAVDKRFRPQVKAASTPTELFGILRQMVEPLQDTHTGLEAQEIAKEFDGWRNDPNHLEDKDWKKAAAIIESKYVHGPLKTFCKGHIQVAILKNAIGYLRVTAFYDYADGGYANQLRCLQQSLDTMFGEAKKLNGLIIDVRLNNGGDDPLGIEIASRLTTKKYLAFTKAARNSTDPDASIHLTPQQPTWVQPSQRPGFTGQIALLIGPDTVSAGETFTMALMGREPHVRRIGLSTQGVFSDVLNRSLPNGWRFHLPNEIYFTASGRAFDAVGVPPDVRVPFFDQEDLQSGRDPALEKAIDWLTKPN
jgi:hypothetical protein